MILTVILTTLSLILNASCLPDGWTSLGCFSDNTDARALSAASYLDPVFSTQETCIEFCNERNYPFAGAEFGRECYCDTQLHNNSTQSELQNCNVACPFDSTVMCGGSNALNLFTKNHGPILITEFPMGQAGQWSYLGSFNNTTPNSEPFAVEAIIAATTTSGSIENCLSWCFNDFGCPLCSVSDGGVCECGDTLSSGRVPAITGQAICTRNSSEICGDTALWQVYEFVPN